MPHTANVADVTQTVNQLVASGAMTPEQGEQVIANQQQTSAQPAARVRQPKTAPEGPDPIPNQPIPANLPGQDGNESEVLARIVERFNRGEIPSTEGVINEIMRLLNVDRSAALGLYGVIQPDLSQNVGIRVDGQADTALGAETQGDTVSRERLLGNQSREEQRRRLQANTFGPGQTPLAERALSGLFGQFFGQEDITNFGFGGAENVLPIEAAFANFRANPAATQQSLQAGLQDIQGGGFTEEAERRFSDPNRAFNASLQPFLGAITPGVRGQLANIARNRFRTEFAQNPDQFTGGQNLLDLLTRFQGFGR